MTDFGEVTPEKGEPVVVLCLDGFGPLNLQPHPDRRWSEGDGKHKDPTGNQSESKPLALRLWVTSRTRPALVNVTSAIFVSADGSRVLPLGR
ncbi:hypothetical protein [Streptomyces rimosus]|uniref:hypothetical protein n=1 Tax=Streptomyces rimosus TaxID=1927 RepID=UPI0004C08709